MLKVVTKCLICYFRVREWLGALLEAWKYFWPRVGFGLLTISHVFDFWDCVPRSLETRVAPLRAYWKTIQFRLKFRLIRSPETPWKPIQPDTKIPFQPGIRLDFWLPKTLLSGTNRSGGFHKPPERIFLMDSILTSVLISALGSVLLYHIRELLSLFQTRKSFSLSLLLFSHLLSHH